MALIRMYRGLVVSGAILAAFGALLVLTDLYVPMGVSVFGLPFLLAGIVMILLGYWRNEPTPVEPAPGMKFCWYCMKEIPIESKECPNCSLPQHDADD